jgi:hypothetical protein
MLYKTITLELLQQDPQTHERLRKHRMLLPMMELYSQGLKNCHEAWKVVLLRAKPDSDGTQIASEAMELALQELEEALLQESRADATEPATLDRATVFLQRHTPPA